MKNLSERSDFYREKNKSAFALGKLSAKKRFAGKSKEEISAIMKNVRKGKL